LIIRLLPLALTSPAQPTRYRFINLLREEVKRHLQGSTGSGIGYRMAVVRRLLVILAVALVAASAASAAPARLSVISRDTFAVRGTGFQPGEHVLVVVVANGDRASKRLIAGIRGGFVTRFPSVQLGACPAYTVRATGAAGSRAVLKVMPECPQPLTP
jgi:hypothetical protein